MDNIKEVEIFSGSRPEAAECQYKWSTCTKNPGHQNFISAKDFKDIYIPKVQDARSREVLRSRIDLTVRLRVHYTSTERPDGDNFSGFRGTRLRRMGTGFIHSLDVVNINESRHFESGRDITKKCWRFEVQTARHVVYNTEEARETKVDLFLDDESCDRDGKMKSVWGVEAKRCDSDTDLCRMVCETCDIDLGERIESALNSFSKRDRKLSLDLGGLYSDLVSAEKEVHLPVLAVSHPHGQPKKITVGKVVHGEAYRYVNYTVPTCPGSSGAPVLTFKPNRDKVRYDTYDLLTSSVHCGSYDKESVNDKDLLDYTGQLNYGLWHY